MKLPIFPTCRFDARLAFLCLIAAVLALAPRSQAAPFDRQIQFRQPDGTTVQLHGKGDEFYAVFETLTGYTVVFDQAQRAYCFAKLGGDGRLVSTGVQAHQGDPGSLGLAPGVRMSQAARRDQVVSRYQQWEQAMQTQQRWGALKQAFNTSQTQNSPPSTTTLGTKVGLTILVDFSDDPATIPQAEVINYCNGDNYTGFGNASSVKKYYQDVSNGLLTYSNVVTIYITAPQPKTYYDDVTQDAGICGNNLLKDVITTMKALPNYTTTILPEFDALTVDGNNYVIACNVFFAGANSGVWAMGLWPHSGGLYYAGPQELSAGGKKVFRYQITDMSSSLSIGTFCHENGHMLCGYPDLYDYDYDSIGGAGNFCLMGYGGGDLNPVQICAYLKRASGWATTTFLDSTSALLGLVTAPMGSNFNHFYSFPKPGTPTEYYLAENRQASGRDATLPGSGILIWHVDELGDRDNQSLAYNASHANYELTLMQADNQWHFERYMNYGDSRDPFYAGNPSSTYNNEFSDSSAPSARWWDGSPSGIYFSDFSSNAPTMTFRIGYGLALKISTNYVVDANGNGLIDYNECNDLYVVLTNGSYLGVTNIQATLSSTTPGVQVARATSSYPAIPPGSSAVNLTAFKISTSPWFNCGAPIDFSLLVKTDLATSTNAFSVKTGMPGLPIRFSSTSPVNIPDAGSTNCPLVVSNVTFALNKVTVSVFLTHTWDSDLVLQLISPDGTTNTLSRSRGGSGENYGIACAPDSLRTTFDDAATTPIGSGFPPFLGSYRPENSLSVFSGKAGTNVNGTWNLRVVDQARFDVGTVQCWSLDVTPTVCVDGGGECPGSDLAVGMTVAPDPTMIGNQIVYTINLTNKGPSSAKNVSLSQLLPPSALFVSATLSQGAFSQAGGVVTCNLGLMPSSSTAVISVTALPTAAGIITSTVTATSEQPDFNSLDNTAVAVCRVNPPTADIAVGVAGPASSIMGQTVRYTISVTNKGPSDASNVTLTNTYGGLLGVVSASSSQGSAIPGSNSVLFSFGPLAIGARAVGTVDVAPQAEGTILAKVSGGASQYDPSLGNNSASTATLVGPSADLAVTISGQPNPVVTGSNIVYEVTLTNRGPSLASAVTLLTTLPPSFNILSYDASVGTVLNNTNVVSLTIPALASGAGGIVTIRANAIVSGTNTVTAFVAATQADPVLANNSASTTTIVAPPFVSIVAAGARLSAESLSPANGALENGETVTASLRLRNAGNVSTSNLVARLIATNGITPVGGDTQPYGILFAGNSGEDRSFSFSATGAAGATVTAVLQLQDGSTSHGTVSFPFVIPSSRRFANGEKITVRDNLPAQPYPSVITVSNLTGTLGKVTVTLSNLSHTFPKDIDVVLYHTNTQRKAILMSGAGAARLVGAPPVTITFDDQAATLLPDEFTQIASGSYKPANYLGDNNLPAPAPAAPYPASLATFNAGSGNGEWQLYVNDHQGGDAGVISNGWSLELTMLTPVNKVADLALAATGPASGALVGSPLTFTFMITNLGPNSASSVAFSNAIPANLTVSTMTASQGSLGIVGNSILGNLGTLNAGASATVTVVAVPQPGITTSFVNRAVVTTFDTDLNPVNNSVSVNTSLAVPVANLSLTQVAPDVAVIGSNVLITLSVTNAGPQTALNTILTDTLPAGLSFLRATNDSGAWTNLGNVVTFLVGDLPAGAARTFSVVAVAAQLSAATNTAVVTTASSDPVAENNTTSFVVNVGNPAASLMANGALLLNESGPVNGTIDPGETVTVALALLNHGSADTSTNVQAALLPLGGIVSDGSPQVYGKIALGASVSKPFTFKAPETGATTLYATLHVQDATNDLGTVSYAFNLPTLGTFSSTAGLTIPERGTASLYPSTIQVSGMTGVVDRVTVRVHGLTHRFPQDLSLLLVSPNSGNVLLMSHAGGSHSVTNLEFGFAANAAQAIPNTAELETTLYLPAHYGAAAVFPPSAPASPYGANLAALNGASPNGDWKLYVVDDVTGDGGTISAGWSLEITTVLTVNPIADLAVTLSSAPASIFVGATITNSLALSNFGPDAAAEIKVTNTLPAAVTYVSGTASAGSVTNLGDGLVVWTLPSLASGGSATAEVVYAPTLGGTLLSVVNVSSDSATDLNKGNNGGQSSVLAFSVAPAYLSGSVTNDQFSLTLQGQEGMTYIIHVSSDLNAWTPISTNVAPVGGIIKVIDNVPGIAQRYYRSTRVLP